jgi:hypothetical protein
MADDKASEPPEDAARPGGRWRNDDLKRALRIAQDAKLPSYRVEIAPDGTISIIVSVPAPDAP